MNLARALGQTERAQGLANDYLRRFPEGTYASRARAIVHAP
jgi:hypothetical protein